MNYNVERLYADFSDPDNDGDTDTPGTTNDPDNDHSPGMSILALGHAVGEMKKAHDKGDMRAVKHHVARAEHHLAKIKMAY